jgi:hypothetical protein
MKTILDEIPAHWKLLDAGIYEDIEDHRLHMIVEETLDHFGWPHTPEWESWAIKIFEEEVQKRWPDANWHIVRHPRAG